MSMADNQFSNIDNRREAINHLKRIRGQMRTLEEYVGTGESTAKIAALSNSIAKSFDSLRLKILEGYVVHELVKNRVSADKLKQLTELLKAFKK